jgi:two-component system cell cycle sensor histidine kinase/response regulator CckA
MNTSIMVVEDEILIANDIRRILTGFGYDVLPLAATGSDALRTAEARTPDLVLMDIKLKGAVDGIETAARLQEKHGTPIVYMTSHSDETTLARAKQTNPFGYIIKPFTDRELRTCIEVALGKHELESKLIARERWFSTTLRSIGDAVIATDEREVIMFMNAAAETLTGWQMGDGIGRKLGEVVHLVDHENKPLPALVTHGLQSGFAAMLPHGSEIVSRDGRRLPIDDSATVIKDDRGVVLGCVVVFRDITDRVKMEKRLALSERLAALGTMAAEVAHEINNPLAYVTLNVDYVLDALATVDPDGATAFRPTREEVDELRKALQEASEGCATVRKVVQNMRRFARVESGARTLVDLPDVLNAAARMTANAIRHHALLRFVYGTTPFVEASEGQLIQVFMNLLINAYHAVGEGNAREQEIRIVTFTDEGGRAVVEVHDTGCGIPRENLSGIFDPFFTTKKVEEGTGLGLSICHGIVAGLGGSITVDSEVGRGSIFRVVLPPADRKREEPASPQADTSSSQRGRILVVDDEVAVGAALGRVLRREHTVVVEADAREALARLAKEDFDVIFCDLMMPGMSGVEFYETLARSNAAAARRVVFMTGGAFTARSKTFLESVANVSIAKPFDVVTLKAVIRDFLA